MVTKEKTADVWLNWVLSGDTRHSQLSDINHWLYQTVSTLQNKESARFTKQFVITSIKWPAGVTLAETSDDADCVFSPEPHLLVVLCSRYWNERHGWDGDTSWARTHHMEHHGGPGGRQTAKQRNGRIRDGTQCKKKRTQDWTKFPQLLVLWIPRNCHHIEQLENTGSKAINIRTRDLGWPVTDSSKNSSVPNRKLSKRTSSQIIQKNYRDRDALPWALTVPSFVSLESTLTIVTQSSPAKKDTQDKTLNS